MFFVILMLIGLLASSAYGQEGDIEGVEQAFGKALKQYTAGEFREAASSFDRIVRGYPFNRRTTAAHLMKGKAQLQAGQPLEAAKTLRAFLQSYPHSSYAADAEYVLALTQVHAHRFDMAIESLLGAWTKMRWSVASPGLYSDILAALDAIIDSTADEAKIRVLIRKSSSQESRAYLWLKLAEYQIADAKIIAGAAALDTLDRYYANSRFVQRIAPLRAKVEQRREIKIGVLVPLMKNEEKSPVKELGTDILEGIQFAVDAHNADPSVRTRVRLEVQDTERDPPVTTRLVQKLTGDDEIVAIVGPVFSTTTSAAVGLAEARGVPLITPTANSNGIAAVGPHIFQANPDYETRGRAMARFAVQTKGYIRLAVLAPIDTYAKHMAEAFIREAIRLGAQIVAQEWYQRGSTDLTLQLKNIRRAAMTESSRPMISFAGRWTRDDVAKLLDLGVRRRTIDSLTSRSSIIAAEDLLGPRAKHLLDSAGIKSAHLEAHVDSLEFPAEGIDGIYVPINAPEEIGVVASQIVYFNLKSTVLGSGEWNNLSELGANRRYCSNAYFDSDNYVPENDPTYPSFVESFYEKFKRRPGKNVLYGYDTARLLLSHIHSGATTREALTRALAMTHDYQGYHSKIGFSTGRVNVWLQVLHYDGDQIRLVDEMRVD